MEKQVTEQRDKLVWDDAPGGWTHVPNYVIRSGIDADALQLLLVLMSYAYGDKDTCFPGQETLANDMDVSERTVRNRLGKLTELGLIRYERRGFNKSNIYHIQTSPLRPESQHDDTHSTEVCFRSVRKSASGQLGNRLPDNNKREQQQDKTAVGQINGKIQEAIDALLSIGFAPQKQAERYANRYPERATRAVRYARREGLGPGWVRNMLDQDSEIPDVDEEAVRRQETRVECAAPEDLDDW
jgi:hypothetical protein